MISYRSPINVKCLRTSSPCSGPIDAVLSLESMGAGTEGADQGDIGGKFKITATTTRGTLDLDFIRAPHRSILLLDARTSLKAATVKLPDTYEGKFSLGTTLRRPKVLVDKNVKGRTVMREWKWRGCVKGTGDVGSR